MNSLDSKREFPTLSLNSLKDEGEIVRNWNLLNLPLVTICCATFNHAEYVEMALHSFLTQETKFPFEIVVRDDASTDGTSNIVLKYQKKYPKIIRSIINEENQYIKGERAAQIWPVVARGKYLALCEGDDFWISPTKLQKQVEALEANENINLAFHKSATLKDGKMANSIHFYESRVYKLSDHVLAGFHFIQTNTLMLRKSAFDEKLIKFLSNISVADFFMRFYLGINGAICIEEQMGCYRVLSSGSWSSRLSYSDNQKKHFIHFLSDIEKFDKLLSYRYTQLISRYNEMVLRAVVCSNMKVIDKLKILFNNVDKLNAIKVIKFSAMAVISNKYFYWLKSSVRAS